MLPTDVSRRSAVEHSHKRHPMIPTNKWAPQWPPVWPMDRVLKVTPVWAVLPTQKPDKKLSIGCSLATIPTSVTQINHGTAARYPLRLWIRFSNFGMIAWNASWMGNTLHLSFHGQSLIALKDLNIQEAVVMKNIFLWIITCCERYASSGGWIALT